MLSARQLRHAYGGRTVLAVESLDLAAGSVTALVGPNGAGKSTLLRVLALLERPAAGTLSLDGRELITGTDRRRARRRVTLVEQHPYLFRGTVRHNLHYALALHGIRGPAAAHLARGALDRLHAGELAERPAGELSAGEVQRVALARALALEPQVLLLDEPAGVADRGVLARVYRTLGEEQARGAAVCFASHQLEDAYRWSDRLLALADGQLSQVTPENLFRAVLPEGDGPKTVRLGPLDVHVVTDRSGPVTLAIPPEEILVSLRPLDSSARNAFRGTVTRLAEDGRGGVALTVDAGLDLAARITRPALDELGLHIGSAVVLSFKAMAVRVF
jgi:tungstate transport system ATP-binding protein